MRVALFGGTFDPPHVGHLLAASDAYDRLELDRLVFIPALRQPLKRDFESSEPEHRFRMLELMVAGDSRFSVDPVEIRRTGLSYTVETLDHYARLLPEAARYFLLGEDTYATLPKWRDPGRVAELAHLVVLTRSEDRPATPLGQNDVARHMPVGGPGFPPATVLSRRRVDVSSTEIRERVRAGRSIHGFVTAGVAEYIDANGLYR